MKSVAIYFLSLAAYSFHCNAAVINVDSPNASSQELRNNVKTLRILRRDVGSCERFIRTYDQRKYDSCITLDKLNPFCNEHQCPNKPSPPKRIHHIFYLNNATKKLDLTVTWEYPKFGLNNLCGFQVRFASLGSVTKTNCIQFNSKNLLSNTYRYLHFNANYNITVTSLPAFNNIDESSRFVTLKSPDKCTLLRQLNEALPWHCGLKTNFSVACESGKINVTLEKPSNVDIDGCISMITLKGSHKPINMSRHKTSESFVVYKGLQLDIQYVLQVAFIKGREHRTIYSQPFICKSPPEPTPKKSFIDGPRVEEENRLLLISLISTAVFIVLALIICLKCKLVAKVRNIFIMPHGPDFSYSSEDIPLPDGRNSRVLLVYPSGCEQLNELLLLLGHLLGDMRCKFILDLVMEEAVLEKGHREMFIMKKLEDMKKDDVVILVNYKGTDDHSQNALKCHEEIIFRKIYQKELNAENFIALHFNTENKTEFSSNIYFTGNIVKELEKLVRIIWKIPRYEYGKRCPQENAIEFHKDLTKKIIHKTNEFMASAHYSCYKDECAKGQKTVHNDQKYFPVFNGSTTCTNSFSTLNLPDDDATDDHHSNRKISRLSSSEPLLLNESFI